MIVGTLIDLFFGILRVAFGTFEAVQLPTQAIDVLSTLTVYGMWVVGVDILALFVGTIVFWWVTKFSVGLVVWIWERLPLT